MRFSGNDRKKGKLTRGCELDRSLGDKCKTFSNRLTYTNTHSHTHTLT